MSFSSRRAAYCALCGSALQQRDEAGSPFKDGSDERQWRPRDRLAASDVLDVLL